MRTIGVEARLRRVLFGLSAWLCGGTIVELLLAKHYKEPAQLVPFVLCSLGLIMVVAAWRRPRRASLLALRGMMGVLMVGSLLGVYEHLAGNLAFELEMRPSAVWSDVWFQALRGAAPLLAPGVLAVAGVLAIAATYAHPALAHRQDMAQTHAVAGERSLSQRR